MFVLNLPDHLADVLGDNPEPVFSEMVAIWQEIKTVSARASRETYQRQIKVLPRDQLLREIARLQATNQGNAGSLDYLRKVNMELIEDNHELKAMNRFLEKQVEQINEECHGIMAELERCSNQRTSDLNAVLDRLAEESRAAAQDRIELFPIQD